MSENFEINARIVKERFKKELRFKGEN